MPWKQLLIPGKCNESMPGQVYPLYGIPWCVILDKSGNIIGCGLRGAHLDLLLEEIMQ